MKLSHIGEFGLIDRIARAVRGDLRSGTVGIGDDCAIYPLGPAQSLLVTTDMLIEDVHFLRREAAPSDLGYKALAVNLSDIAAMGGAPSMSFLSLALPSDLDVTWVDAFIEGYRELSHAHGVQLLGGDTTRSPQSITISVTALGFAHPEHIKLRSGACPGDVIYVTSDLGAPGGGLRALFEHIARSADVCELLRRHHRPEPHIEQGRWLAARADVHAMMDVSDGVVADLRRIIERSHCGATVAIDELPISTALARVAAQYGWNAKELALTGGEDYCLIAIGDAATENELRSTYLKQFAAPLYRIGSITERAGELVITHNGAPVAVPRSGFEHFA